MRLVSNEVKAIAIREYTTDRSDGLQAQQSEIQTLQI